jgi:heat shock protein HslJ
MKHRPSILWILPLLTCTMCTSFPVIINLGGARYRDMPTKPLSVVNWNDAEPKLIDPEDVWPSNEVWHLEEINNYRVMSSHLSPQIEFNATRTKIRGQSFCNSYSASCSFYGDTMISIDVIDNTWEYCEGEKEFYIALSKSTDCYVENDKLYLLYEEDEVLQFTRRRTYTR